MAEITKLRQLLKHVGLHNLASLTFELKEDNLNNLDYLEYLLTKEIQMRDSKNIYKRRKASNSPNKTFNDFNLKEAKGITQWQIDKITTLEFLDDETNIIITGTAGVGKTHIAASIGNVAVDKGIKIFYITALNLLLVLNNYANPNSQDKKSIKILDYIKECQLIIIDEFAYTKLNDQDSQTMYHYLTKINRTKSLIIIANKPIAEIPNNFSEKLLGTTLMDRLTENSLRLIVVTHYILKTYCSLVPYRNQKGMLR